MECSIVQIVSSAMPVEDPLGSIRFILHHRLPVEKAFWLVTNYHSKLWNSSCQLNLVKSCWVWGVRNHPQYTHQDLGSGLCHSGFSQQGISQLNSWCLTSSPHSWTPDIMSASFQLSETATNLLSGIVRIDRAVVPTGIAWVLSLQSCSWGKEVNFSQLDEFCQ